MLFPNPTYLLGAVLALPALLAQAAPAHSVNDTFHIAYKPLARHYCNFFDTICHDHDYLSENIVAEVKECKAVGGDNFRLSCIYYERNTTSEARNYVLGETSAIPTSKPGPLQNYETQLDTANMYCSDAMTLCHGFCKGLSGQKLCKPAYPNDTQLVSYFNCKCAGIDYTEYIDGHVTFLWWMA